MADLTGQFYAAEGIHGYGTQWLIGFGASPQQYEAVPYVKKITPGSWNTAVMDKTHLRSPAAHREKKAGLRDSGPFAIEMIYHPNHESQSRAGGGSGAFQAPGGGIFQKWIDRTELNMKLILSDDDETELPFRGVITQCQVGEIGEDNVVPLMVEVTPLADFSSNLP